MNRREGSARPVVRKGADYLGRKVMRPLVRS